MHQQGRNDKQQELPFAQAEGNYAERQGLLDLALMKVKCDCLLAKFLYWIFNVTQGGTLGQLTKTHEELGDRPRGLCCSRSTARRVVSAADRLGMVIITEARHAAGGQKANAYEIDWDGIRRILATDWGRKMRFSNGGAGGQNEHRGGQNEQGAVHFDHPYKEICSLDVLFKTPIPVPAPGPNPPVGSKSGNSLAERLCCESAVLREALGRRIAPLPASERLMHGVYAVLHARHLQKPFAMIVWHRRQLSTPVPVMGDTEADLLLTLAAAEYAKAVPAREIVKNRESIFVATISRRAWTKALPFVPKSRTILDQCIEDFGRAELLELATEPKFLEPTAEGGQAGANVFFVKR